MSWHRMMEFEPPMAGGIVSNRNYTFKILRRTRECGINIPTADIAKQVVACGGKVDKFKKHHLTAGPGERLNSPLVAE